MGAGGVAQAAMADWSKDLEKVFGVAPMKKITLRAGAAAKVAGTKAAKGATGGDMRLSGIPRAKLTVGLSPVTAAGRVVFLWLGATGWTARGLWGLASGGRKKSGMIYPKFGGGRTNRRGPLPRRALKFPDGQFRRQAPYRPQGRSPQAYPKLIAAAAPAASVAGRKQLHSEIRKVLAKPNRYNVVMR